MIASASSTLIVASAALVGIAALGTILGWFTARGRAFFRWIKRHLSLRPVAPSTTIHIEPMRQSCWWSDTELPYGGHHVGFEMPTMVTNLTQGYELRIASAEIRGIKGTVAWSSITSFPSAFQGGVSGAVLPPHTPVDVSVNVVIERDSLPPGPHRARVILRDNLGQNHRSPKLIFNDVKKFSSGECG